jgi:N-acetylglutamate synthase-like GNAT family acetyltransferase
MDIKIREYKKNDCESCIKILKKTLLSWDVDNLIEDLKENYDCERLVVEFDGKIIGLGGYYKPSNAEFEYERYLIKHKKYVCYDWIAIKPEYQKKGIGKKLVEYSEKHALMGGYTHMGVWTVVPDYFKKLGYDYLQDYDYTEDDIYETYLMVKMLK